MKFNEVIQSRRSIRKYLNKKVERSLIDEVIQAGIYAPSWKNSQTARYYVIESEAVLNQFKETCVEGYNQSNIENAPVIMISTFVANRSGFDRDGNAMNSLGNGWGCYDLGMHNQNVILKATELGLDTLVMGIRDEDAIKKLLDIQDTETVVAVIALGYGDINPEMPKRKLVEDITKYY